MQQLTCNIDLSCSFYYLFFSFVLLELKPLVLSGKSWGKNSEKAPKSVKKTVKMYETILPFSCCPLVFPDTRGSVLIFRDPVCCSHRHIG